MEDCDRHELFNTGPLVQHYKKELHITEHSEGKEFKWDLVDMYLQCYQKDNIAAIFTLVHSKGDIDFDIFSP